LEESREQREVKRNAGFGNRYSVFEMGEKKGAERGWMGKPDFLRIGATGVPKQPGTIIKIPPPVGLENGYGLHIRENSRISGVLRELFRGKRA
jgi:hypothetical protein